MTLSALLVCVDEAPAQVLRRVLEELSIRVEPCPDFVRAAIRLAQERFDLVIVDWKSNADVIALLRDTHTSRRARRAFASCSRWASISFCINRSPMSGH